MKFLLFFVIPGALYGQMLAAIGSNERPMGTRYLSDLRWISSTNGFGPVERDMSNGEDLALDGVMMSIRGNTYAKGIGAHGDSDIRINLGGACTQFTATVGIDDEVAAWPGAVSFQVWKGGSTKLYDSGTLTAQSSPVNVNVDIKGVNEMRLLIVKSGPNSNHGDWALASIVCNGTPPPAAVSVTTSMLSDGTTGSAYSQTLTAAGGVAPYMWSITSGSLQGGITLGSSTGIISGTPNTTGTNSITFKATDTLGANGSKTLSLTVNDPSSPPAGSINVISGYGAVGDGSHDDTTNIANALAACPANSQKTVYFPAGTYKITTTLNVGVAGCALWGVRNSSTIKATGAADPMMIFTGSNTNTTIFNMIFDMNNLSDGVFFSQTMTGVVISYSKFVNGYTEIGALSSAASGTRDTSIDHNVFQGLPGDNQFSHIMVFHNPVANTHIDHNYLDTFYQGIQFTDSGGGPATNFSVTNNTFIRGQRSGLEWFGGSDGGVTINTTVTGNWFGQWRQCNPAFDSDCGTNPNGFGNWVGSGQMISWAAGGNNNHISNNFLKCGDGMTNGIEWSSANPGSQLQNNLIKVCTVTIYGSGTATGMTGNTSCTPYNTGYNSGYWGGTDASNHYYTSCSNVGVPADPVAPNPPF